jgi:aminopeptidase N
VAFARVADFATAAYLRQFEPGELSAFYDIRRRALLQKNNLGYRPVDARPIWLNIQLDEYNEYGGRNSIPVVYYKGGYIMEMLRALMYDSKLQNPDSRFIAMLRDFTSTYAGKNASTEDFRQIVEKHMGGSMEWFFNQWVYGAYMPKYDFSYRIADSAGGQTEVSMSLTQSEVPEGFHMELPLYVVVKGQQQYLGMIGVTGSKPLKTSVKLPMRPEKVILDPNRSILAEIRQ